MSKSKSLDLTNGPILKTLAELALPIMASSFLGTAYSITDMAWIGMLGSKAVAGAGVGSMYVWLSQGIASLPRMGGQVGVAQSCGKGDTETAGRFANASLQVTLLLGILYAVLCVTLADPLLSIFNLPDSQTYAAAKSYLMITCGLIIFSFLNITLTGLSTAQGDSKTPFKANLAGLVMNMILDPVLILGLGPFPRLETTGAAIATVLSQALVLAALLIGILRSKMENNVLKHLRLTALYPGYYYKHVFKIGFPTAVQGSLYCIISMVLTRMVSPFGPAALATQRVGGQIESVSWNTADGFAAALNAFVGQNYGAGKPDRIRKGYSVSFRLLTVWGLFITAAFVFFPRPIASLFFHEADALNIAVGYLMIIGFSEAFMTIELMTIGALSGLGRTNLCSGISIVLTGARIPLALLFTRIGLGLEGIWWALSLTSIVKGIIFYFTFRHISRKL